MSFSTHLTDYVMCTVHSLINFDFLSASDIVYDLEFVGPLEFKLVAPMLEQLKPLQCISIKPYIHPAPKESMHCCGLNLFWDERNEIQILGPQIVD